MGTPLTLARAPLAEGEVATGTASRWLDAALALDRWMAERGDEGHDPFDFLSSPRVQRLTFGSRWGAVAWTQLGKRSPVQLRGVFGVPRARNAKGIGLAVAAQVRLARVVAGDGPRARARELVDWLATQRAEGYPGAGWGYPFPWANRDFHAPVGTPSSVVTAFVGHALLDAADAFGWEECGQLAAEGGDFLRVALNRLPGSDGSFCWSYTPLDRRGVHNASLLAASLVARLGRVAGAGDGVEEAMGAARFTVRAQRADGSWPYGVARRDAWVDSFHTSYNLVALRTIGEAAGSAEFEGAIERGLDYWRRAFLVGPAVSYFPDTPYPVDLHAVAHSILTLLTFRDRMPDAVATAERLAAWCLEEMRDPEGFFYYQRHRRWTNRLPYMRWIQAWMLLALSELAAVVRAPSA
jgi:hypothetical protein